MDCSWSDPAGKGWIVWSPGPDKDYDWTLKTIAAFDDPVRSTPTAALLEETHDVTNGAISSGDLWRAGP